jgi:hypothetical protein
MTRLMIFDDFLSNPEEYRKAALANEFKSYTFPQCTFHGIAQPAPPLVPAKIMRLMPMLKPTLSFFRKSPVGQKEPHFIHTDADMGQWSAILYLNPQPIAGDGTSFWTHEENGTIESAIPHEYSEQGRSSNGWELRETVPAKFNRLLLFPATYFHSRAIFDNWGEGDEARLTQVTFGVFQ